MDPLQGSFTHVVLYHLLQEQHPVKIDVEIEPGGEANIEGG